VHKGVVVICHRAESFSEVIVLVSKIWVSIYHKYCGIEVEKVSELGRT
jgi:hypothetical protein